MNNVTLAPHIGSATETTRDLMLKRAIHNVIHGIDGKAPVDVVKELDRIRRRELNCVFLFISLEGIRRKASF